MLVSLTCASFTFDSCQTSLRPFDLWEEKQKPERGAIRPCEEQREDSEQADERRDLR